MSSLKSQMLLIKLTNSIFLESLDREIQLLNSLGNSSPSPNPSTQDPSKREGHPELEHGVDNVDQVLATEHLRWIHHTIQGWNLSLVFFFSNWDVPSMCLPAGANVMFHFFPLQLQWLESWWTYIAFLKFMKDHHDAIKQTRLMIRIDMYPRKILHN